MYVKVHGRILFSTKEPKLHTGAEHAVHDVKQDVYEEHEKSLYSKRCVNFSVY